MKVYGKTYEDRFAFLGTQYDNQILIGDNKKEIKFSELIKKNIVVFMPEVLIKKFQKTYEGKEKVKIHRGGAGRVLGIELDYLMFKNFNAICGYSNFKDLKKAFNWETDNEAELMRNYINFLHKKENGLGLYNSIIAMAARSYICEAAMYKGLSGEMFYISNNSLPKSNEERRFVFNYYKNELLEKNGKIYGVLECKPGYYQNVLRIDLNNFYGFIQCAEKFLSNNPYQVLTGKVEPIYDYLPMPYRQKIIHNYKVAKAKDKEGNYLYSKGIRQIHKDMNNITPGRGENIDIYLKRSAKRTASALQPQHSFKIVSKGIDFLNAYTEIFKQCGATIVSRDTDSIKLTGLTKEQGLKVVNYINKKVVNCLIAAGFDDEDANCGIGQFKIEGYSKEFYQFADKAYCFTQNEAIKITFAGMKEEEKEALLKSNSTFKEVVEALKLRQTHTEMPLEINGQWLLEFTGGNSYVK